MHGHNVRHWTGKHRQKSARVTNVRSVFSAVFITRVQRALQVADLHSRHPGRFLAVQTHSGPQQSVLGWRSCSCIISPVDDAVLLTRQSCWLPHRIRWFKAKLGRIPWDAPITCLSATCPLCTRSHCYLAHQQTTSGDWSNQNPSMKKRTMYFPRGKQQHRAERTLILLQPLPSLYLPLSASEVSCAGENAAETSQKTVSVYWFITRVMKGLKQLMHLFYEICRHFHEIFFFL